MITKTKLTVRHALISDRNSLANIFHFEPFVHRHLDWRPPLDWLGYEPYLILEKQERPVAALACPPDPPGIAWIRVFSCQSRFPADTAWKLLWESAKENLKQMEVDSAAAIPLKDWFLNTIIKHGFKLQHHVVVLAWEKDNLDVLPTPSPVKIRRMRQEDLEKVHQIDQEAFGLIWRNSYESLQLAFNQAAYATVAENEDGITGYQISTPSPLGAHLARLAVTPRIQNQGIGYSLVYDLQQQFTNMRLSRLTVNTQDINQSSLALYDKAGFVRTGESYPVYLYDI
jgi:ribosomal-protein-alanine N-acetyltransferase